MTTLKPGLIAATALIGALAAGAGAGGASAQSWGMDQLMMQNMAFDQMMADQAAAIAQQWYDDVQAYRRATGDYATPIHSGFNASTLAQANRELSQAYDAYNQSAFRNSQTMADAVDTYGRQAILGQSNYVGPYGDTHAVPNGHNYYWMDDSGAIYGTNTYSPPDYQNWYHRMTPVE